MRTFDSLRIFDSHTHIFPEKIADKAVEGIGSFYDMMTMQHTGTAENLTQLLKDNNVSGCMVCSVATVPEQVESINDFIAQSVKDSDGFMTGFCSLHPDMSQEQTDCEIIRATSLGLKGIKLHPDFQRFEADSAKAYAIYEVIGDRLPVLIHAGDHRYSFSSPKRIARAMTRFPALTLIAAHLGGWSEWDDAVSELAGRFGDKLYVDTSSSLYSMTAEKAREYVLAFGEDHVLFGTDYPMWDIAEELERFAKIDLSDTAREKILYSNSAKLLNLET
jgi:hypothetical protein